MTRVIAVACVLCFLSGPLWSVEDIALVDTFEALQKVKPIRLSSGWDVRLALGPGGKVAGPWQLLYCLAEFPGEGKDPVPVGRGDYGDGDRQLLGPVTWRFVSLPERKGPVDRSKVAYGRMTLPRHALYCQTIPLAWKGRYRLRVFGPKDKVIAERILTVAAGRRNYWRGFADQRMMVRLVRKGEPDPPPRYRVSAHSYPAFPRLEPLIPVVDFTRREIKALHETPPPGTVPGKAIWRLGNSPMRKIREGEEDYGAALSIEKDAFVFRAPLGMHIRGDMHLLARWWVNAKPKPDKEGPLEGIMRMNGIVEFTREFRVALGLPAILGELKPGDKVALQVMYSPAEYEEMFPPAPGKAKEALRLLDDGKQIARVPMCSNRIEFVVTQKMLDARPKTTKR